MNVVMVMASYSPSEAKQVWLEREVRSFKTALDRVSVHPMLQQSEYWNAGSENQLSSSCFGPTATDTRTFGDCLDAFGGSGDACSS